MQAPPPTVSVVMPTFNRRHLLPDALDPLLADPDALEILIVDDGSSDGTADLLRARSVTDSRLKPLYIENCGKAGARQAGVECATGDIVLLLDDDVVAGPGLVARHASMHMGVDDLVVLGYMPVSLSDSRRNGHAPTYLYASEYELRCNVYETDESNILRNLWGGNMSLRRDQALRVRLVSPDYTEGYHQDRDFGLRCHKAGLRGRFSRKLRAEHRHTRALKSFAQDAQHQGAGRARLYSLHGDVLGSMPDDEFALGLPPPLRAWLHACRRPWVGRSSAGALAAAANACVNVGWFQGEMNALKLLRRVEHQRAAALAASR